LLQREPNLLLRIVSAHAGNDPIAHVSAAVLTF
jgi:hypothetical protein